MVDLYCASFKQVPKRIVLDIDDTFDAVHGGQQLRLFNADYDEYGFQPIVVFDGGGRFIAAVLRPGRRARRSAPSYAASCARSAPTGRRRKSCRQPLLLPRGSRLVSEQWSRLHFRRRTHHDAARISKRWKLRPASKLRRRMASYAASRSSSTALQVGAASSRSSPVSRSETKAPIHASSSPILTSATLACSTKMSTAGAARRKIISSPGRHIWRPTEHRARRRPPTSSGCSCTAGPTGSCGAGALQCPNVRCGASRNSTSCACG